MDARAMLRAAMDTNQHILEGTMEGVTQDVAHWSPSGNPVPVGANYAHILMSEDFLLSGLRGVQPLGMTTFGGKMGISEPPPDPGAAWDAWAGRVKVDVAQLRAYAQAVYANTDAYLASASQADFDTVGEHPLSPVVPPMSKVGFVANVLLGHVANHCGEISTVKGLQKLKGYPF